MRPDQQARHAQKTPQTPQDPWRIRPADVYNLDQMVKAVLRARLATDQAVTASDVLNPATPGLTMQLSTEARFRFRPFSQPGGHTANIRWTCIP